MPFLVFCFDLPDVWEWFERRAWWRQGYQSRTCTVDLKCCSNYCLHYAFVIPCLDAQRPAFHAAAREAAHFFLFFLWSLTSAEGKSSSKCRESRQWGPLWVKMWMDWNWRRTKPNCFHSHIMLELNLVCLLYLNIWPWLSKCNTHDITFCPSWRKCC